MNLIISNKEELEELVKTSVDQSLDQFFQKREQETQSSKYFTVKEASKHLRVSELTVRNYIKRGMILAEKVGNRLLIDRDKLVAQLKEVKSLKYKRC